VGALAVKGSGVEAWATDNKHWVIKENKKHGLVIGRVPRENFVNDLWGEFWALGAGLKCPRTIFCAKTRAGYQIGRFWHCPYRLWELTSGPFRIGPDVSQGFITLNWGIELAFALKYRHVISARAHDCIREASNHVRNAVYFAAFERTLTQNIAKLTIHECQLSPFAFHLANIAYSGETTGFDRLEGPFSMINAFRLGILTGLLEIWAAISWLRAATGKFALPFTELFHRFQEELEASGVRNGTSKFFLDGDDVNKVFSDARTGRLKEPLYPLFFSVRSKGDIRMFIAACETFFAGLTKAFSGDFTDLADLHSWRDHVNFARCEEVRICQSMAGDVLGARKKKFLRRVRKQRLLQRQYEQSHRLK